MVRKKNYSVSRNSAVHICGRQVVESWVNFKGILMKFRKIFYRFLTCLLKSCLKEKNSTIQTWEFVNVCVILLKIKSS